MLKSMEKNTKNTMSTKKQSLENSLENSWRKTLKTFSYPDLPYPLIIDLNDTLPEKIDDCDIDTAFINMNNNQISINSGFIDELTAKGLDTDSAFSGILHHEVNHYSYCPANLEQLLKITHAISKISKKHSRIIANYFMDVIINLDLMLRKKNTDIERVYSSLDKEHNIDKLICLLYQKKTGIDMKVTLRGPRWQKKLFELNSIDYFEKDKWLINAQIFSKIIYKMFRKSKKTLKPINIFDANSYSDSEKEKALRSIIKEMSPEEVREIVEENHFNTDFLAQSLDIIYYEELSQMYKIKISELKKRNNEDAQTHEHKKWETGQSPSDIDVFNSYGKYIPGITQSWKKENGESHGVARAIPDLIIAIDSSQSMKNPYNEKSYAVLGAFCTAKCYLEKDSRVSTYNFSSNNLVTDFSREKTKIFSNIMTYQNDITLFDTGVLSELAAKSKNTCDVVILSDMEISNINEMFSYLINMKQTNRIILVNTGREIESTHSRSLKIYNIKDEADIPKILISEFEELSWVQHE